MKYNRLRWYTLKYFRSWDDPFLNFAVAAKLALVSRFWFFWSKKGIFFLTCGFQLIVGFLFLINIFISRSSVPQGPIDHQVRSMKAGEAVDYMKMGLVKEVRRNGAVVHVKEEGEDKEQRFFIPGKASKILLTNS